MLQQLLHNGPAAAVENLFCSSILLLLLLLLLLLFDTGNIISDKSNLSDIKTYTYQFLILIYLLLSYFGRTFAFYFNFSFIVFIANSLHQATYSHTYLVPKMLVFENVLLVLFQSFFKKNLTKKELLYQSLKLLLRLWEDSQHFKLNSNVRSHSVGR